MLPTLESLLGCRAEHFTCVLLWPSSEPYEGGVVSSSHFQDEEWELWEGHWVTLDEEPSEEWQGQDKHAVWLTLKAQLLTVVPFCLQRKEQERNKKSVRSHLSMSLQDRVPLSASLSCSAQEPEVRALTCNLDSDQGCACAAKAAGTHPGLGGKIPSSEFCGAPELGKERSYISIVTNLCMQFSISFHYGCRQQITTILTFTWVCHQ